MRRRCARGAPRLGQAGESRARSCALAAISCARVATKSVRVRCVRAGMWLRSVCVLMRLRSRVDAVRVYSAASQAYADMRGAATTLAKPSAMAKRKHQLGALFHQFKSQEADLLEARGSGKAAKAQTRSKYGEARGGVTEAARGRASRGRLHVCTRADEHAIAPSCARARARVCALCPPRLVINVDLAWEASSRRACYY